MDDPMPCNQEKGTRNTKRANITGQASNTQNTHTPPNKHGDAYTHKPTKPDRAQNNHLTHTYDKEPSTT